MARRASHGPDNLFAKLSMDWRTFNSSNEYPNYQ